MCGFLKSLLLGVCLLGIQACSIVDDYVLGKDNTIIPKPLPEIHAKVQFRKLWSTPVASSGRTRGYYKLKPEIVGQTIYTANASGQVSAVSRQHGRVVWTTQLKRKVVSGPSVGHGIVVIGTDAGTLIALSQADGHRIWEANLSDDALSKSAITAHTVIAKTVDGHLYSFDLQSGKQIWVVEHGSPNLILKASSSPKIMDDQIIVGYSDGKLDAIDLDTGHLTWQRGIAYSSGSSDVERLVDIDADPIIRGNIAYLASYQGYIGAFNLDDGHFIWSKRASVYKNMVIDAHTLYVVDSNDVVWAYDRSSGQVKWKQAALRGYGITEPVLMGARLVVGDKRGNLHGLSKATGTPIGRDNLGAAITIAPAKTGERLIVMTNNGVLQAYQIQTIS